LCPAASNQEIQYLVFGRCRIHDCHLALAMGLP
jgi:hypothetical protein